MEGITREQILEALAADNTIIGDILPTIQETDQFKTLLTNKSNAMFQERIDEEIRGTHSKYDADMLNILGEKPGAKEDGARQKTYEKAKELFTELKELRSKKESLTKDAEVAALQAKIEDLKTNGAGKQIQQMFDQAKETWSAERETLVSKLEKAESEKTNFIKKSEISGAMKGIKINPDINEIVANTIIKNEEDRLLANSKYQDGKLVFLKEDGSVHMNPTTFVPLTAEEIIQNSKVIAGISLKDDQQQRGGGAAATIQGSLSINKVDGKDTKTLNIVPGSFKSRTEFMEVATKLLLESGVTRRDADWDNIIAAAYKENNVDQLPFTA